MQFYRDAVLRWGEVYVKSTDVTIPITAEALYGFFRQLFVFFVISAVFWSRVVTGQRARQTIGWVPARPKPWYKIWNVTKWMGFRYGRDLAACDILFYFFTRRYQPHHQKKGHKSRHKVSKGHLP